MMERHMFQGSWRGRGAAVLAVLLGACGSSSSGARPGAGFAATNPAGTGGAMGVFGNAPQSSASAAPIAAAGVTGCRCVGAVGKWRREFAISNVLPCQDNPQPDHTFRLARNHREGDNPQIAISTGGADTLECLLRRIGVDASEYVPGPGGEGHIHIYQ